MARTAKEYRENVLALASEAFNDHEIVRRQLWGETLGSWTIKKPGSSLYWAQVCILESGAVLAHGDIQPVIFGYGDGKDQFGMLEWIARADPGYYLEKARIGSRMKFKHIDEDVAKADIVRRVEALGIEEKEHRITSRTRRALGDALNELRDGVPLEIVRVHAYEETHDPELLEGVGEVEDPRVTYAHQAIVKLYRLLSAEVAAT